MVFPKTLSQLISMLERLPGVGPKAAQKLALHLLGRPVEEIEQLASLLLQARSQVRQCEKCFFLSEEPVCEICRDPRRDAKLICVVAEPIDVLAIERAGFFKGIYHVLHGLLSPGDGTYPEHLKIGALLERVQKEQPQEVILATSPKIEGNITADYIARQLKPTGIYVTRIAYGVPYGQNLGDIGIESLGGGFGGRHPI
jgi:recombination protein RecR